MSLTEFKDAVDAVAKIVELPTAVAAAILAYQRWFRPAAPGVSLDGIVFLPPGSDKMISGQDTMLAIQLRLFNAGSFPESLAEINVFNLVVTVNETRCSFTAVAFLKALKLTAADNDKSHGAGRVPGMLEFRIEPEELVHSMYLPGGSQLPLNLLFVPDLGQSFVAAPGLVSIALDIQVKTARGKSLSLPKLIKYRRIDAEEAQYLQIGKTAWLTWHLSDSPL